MASKKLKELEQRVEALEKNTLVKYKCQIAAKNKEIKMLRDRLDQYELKANNKVEINFSGEDKND